MLADFVNSLLAGCGKTSDTHNTLVRSDSQSEGFNNLRMLHQQHSAQFLQCMVDSELFRRL